jgi:FkbM family methyltransferase
MNTQIMFDIGAHEGQSSIFKAVENENLHVYAFEPVAKLADDIKTKTNNLKNYTLVSKAVSDYNGEAFFNVRGEGDWGQGSLSDFTSNIDTVWPDSNLRFTDKIKVEVIRLDTFIEQHNIERINYLHIDAQGGDLRVLKGLGKYISIVDKGVVEASNPDKIYYTDQNTVDSTVDFLNKAGFDIISIDSNDNISNEYNIHFEAKRN